MRPDFLHIGAPRAGSVWLFKNLKRHPQIWLPPLKNISYFHPYFQRYRLFKIMLFWRLILRPRTKERALWYFRHFFSPGLSERWYLKQFPDNPDLVKGESAEDYGTLPEKDIARIQALMPDIKIIHVWRNPVDRLISQAKLDLLSRKQYEADNLPLDVLMDKLQEQHHIDGSRYLEIYERWRKFFPEDQFLIIFFEDIMERPHETLQKICAFLGIDYCKDYFEDKAETKENASKGYNIPPEALTYVRELFRGDIERMATLYGAPATRWLEELEVSKQ